MERIPLYNLATDYSSDVYNSGRWIDGVLMRELEERLKSYLGVRYVVLTNSGTSSLLAAYWVLRNNFKAIRTCPYTWPATYQTAHILNYKLNFQRHVLRDEAEFASEDLNVLVHLFGQPSQLLKQIQSYTFLEDAAQSFGAEYQGKKVGSLGLIGCYSFYPTKTLHACGHGGAISTNDQGLYKEMKLFVECGRWQGQVTETPALNLRLDEVKAEFLLKELDQYDQRMDIQRHLAQSFCEVVPGPQPFLDERPGDRHVYSVCNLLVDRRDALRAFLAERGIDSMVYYDNNILPQAQREFYRDVTERVIAIPCRWNLSQKETEHITGSLREWFEK